MIFTPENAQLILEGRKRQDRRLVKPGDCIVTPNIGSDPAIYRNGRLLWQVNRIYAIQPGQSWPAIGHFRLLDWWREQLQDITPEDIQDEGISRTDLGDFTPLDFGAPDEYDAFIARWNSINRKPGTRWLNNPMVWVLEFELVYTP